MRTSAKLAMAAVAAASVGVAGCSGSSSPKEPGTTTASPQTTGTGPASPNPTSETGTPPVTPSDSQQVYHGSIGSSGLTCVAFRSDKGTLYALTGRGVTKKVIDINRSGRVRDSPRGTPKSPPKIAKVTVVGHVEPNAVNTCGYATLVTSKVTIESVTVKSVPPGLPMR